MPDRVDEDRRHFIVDCVVDVIAGTGQQEPTDARQPCPAVRNADARGLRETF